MVSFLVAHDKLPALHVVDAATGQLIGADDLIAAISGS